ncbi:hypothetical protein GJ744_007775 [Endocarpon pusillum]|uniref:Uncharacterized protein n=1 Tax=Endocarpon pusillum TaxID=364733 RepID=A0A8H7AUE1_9EURO|nr:hypothetical protein GJ744_007775 [Endocarpon pusillum]
MSTVSPDPYSHRIWSGVINAVGSTVIQGDTTAGRDIINLTLNSFLPRAEAFYDLCQSSDDPFKDVAGELKDLLSGFEQAEGFLNKGHLDQAQQDVLARHLSQGHGIVEGLQQLKSGLDASNMLPTEQVNGGLLQRLAELMNKLRLRVASINYFNTTISSQAHLGQLIRQTIKEHFPVDDQQSQHTFWTAQSQTSEQMESWRQLRKKLQDLCSGDPSQLKTNQTRILMILRQYYSRDVLTDAFFQDEIEGIDDSDEDNLTSRDASPRRDSDEDNLTSRDASPSRDSDEDNLISRDVSPCRDSDEDNLTLRDASPCRDRSRDVREDHNLKHANLLTPSWELRNKTFTWINLRVNCNIRLEAWTYHSPNPRPVAVTAMNLFASAELDP